MARFTFGYIQQLVETLVCDGSRLLIKADVNICGRNCLTSSLPVRRTFLFLLIIYDNLGDMTLSIVPPRNPGVVYFNRPQSILCGFYYSISLVQLFFSVSLAKAVLFSLSLPLGNFVQLILLSLSYLVLLSQSCSVSLAQPVLLNWSHSIDLT